MLILHLHILQLSEQRGVVGHMDAGQPVLLPLGGEPVSYTHLDVYKRQQLTCDELAEYSHSLGWIDVCKGWQETP